MRTSSGFFIDISYPIDEGIAIYPGNPGLSIERVQRIDKGDSANVSLISIGSHTGTHIDAPAHFIEKGTTIDRIPLDRMNGVARVIDATGREIIDTDFLRKITIKKEDILLFRTDNSSRWKLDRILDNYVTISYDAANYLVDMGVKLVGIDYLTIEIPREKRIKGQFVHRTLLESGVLICEALKLKDVNAGEYDFFCFPLNIRGVDGCPVRCVLCEIGN